MRNIENIMESLWLTHILCEGFCEVCNNNGNKREKEEFVFLGISNAPFLQRKKKRKFCFDSCKKILTLFKI